MLGTKEIYEKAKGMTLEELPEFLNQLAKEKVDYNTVISAIGASAIATVNAMNEAFGGITGAQAGFLMWEIVTHLNYTHNKTGLKMVDYDNMLYPQYDDRFDNTIKESTWKLLQEQAKHLLETENKDFIAPRVWEHWESIVAGKVPFGYRVVK